MSFVIQEARLGLPQITSINDSAVVPLGTRVKAYDPTYGEGEFIFLKGVANVARGSCVLYNMDDYTTSLLAANDIGPVAFAMAAVVADKYGWFQIYGKAVGKVLAAFADNANCYATATAGSIDDAVVAGDRIKNCKGASAIDTPATGLAELEIQYPFMDDAVAA